MVRNSMAVVREMFATVIYRFGDIAWPARPPELLGRPTLLYQTFSCGGVGFL